jgi:tRNA modification GTPase
MPFVDTIIALSSGRLPAGLAVIRVSGPHTRFVVETIMGKLPSPRLATYGALSRRDGALLDKGLALFFPAPGSFTGEDVAEFHVHGGRALVAALLDELSAIPGVRHAEPGEFTRRAFLNGRLDLTETEALADLINAETEAQRRFAVRNATGAQSGLYLDWRQRLIHARAMIEADIDFADEEDVPGSVADAVWSEVRMLMAKIADHIAGFRAAEIIREGFDVVILGAPNSGKSSLFNALIKRDAAIVTSEAGTTRDLLEVSLDLQGTLVRVTDTAGIRDGAGMVEAIGIERAQARAGEADLILVLEDMRTPIGFELGPATAPLLKVGTKSDLIEDGFSRGQNKLYDIVISTIDGSGITDLLDEIGRRAADAINPAADVLPSRMRHVELLRETLRYLGEAVGTGGSPLELRSEALRLAGRSLGRIAGSVDVEDLLDVIFSQFCIGK